jgi:hypothetical protein
VSRSSARDPDAGPGAPAARRARPPAPDPGDRGRIETVGGLVALAAVCAAVSIHAGVLADAAPTPDRDVADPTLAATHDRLAVAGVIDPARAANATLPAPDGYRLNVTVAVTDGDDGTVDRRLTRGPAPPASVPDGPSAPPGTEDLPAGVDAAARTASVRVGAGAVRVGRLRVVVWR